MAASNSRALTRMAHTQEYCKCRAAAAATTNSTHARISGLAFGRIMLPYFINYYYYY